jgi:hypothetical protein
MDPIPVFPIIALISLPTVMFGGYMLHLSLAKIPDMQKTLDFYQIERTADSSNSIVLPLGRIWMIRAPRVRSRGASRPTR